MDSGARTLPITYATAKLLLKKAGDMFDLNMRPYEPCRRSGSFPAGSVRFRSGMKDAFASRPDISAQGFTPG